MFPEHFDIILHHLLVNISGCIVKSKVSQIPQKMMY